MQSYTISGTVLLGQKRSNETGAATANLELTLAKNLPKGLYLCTVILNNKKYTGLLYHGHNSLSQKDCLEVHILNFSQDIYGQGIKVTTEKFIRPEKKFATTQELKEQIKKDLDLIK